MTTLRGTFRLTRISLALSPLADGLAGAALAAHLGLPKSPAELTTSLLASLALFVFGMAGNDYCDREIDRERGRRPIPTGEVSRQAALAIVWVSAILAIGFAAATSTTALCIALAMLCAIGLYNATPGHLGLVGPFVLGSIRGANLLLGASMALTSAYLPAVAYAVFIGAISFAGRMEDGALRATRGRIATLTTCAALAGLSAPFLAAFELGNSISPIAVVIAAGLVVWLILRYRDLVSEPIVAGPRLARFVGASLGAMFLFDASLAAQGEHVVTCGVVLLMFVGSRALVRAFPPS